MGKFDDYNKVADPLILTINGHEYTIPEVGMKDGIRLTDQAENKDAERIPNDEFRRMMLGGAYDQMVEDNVPASAVMRAIETAYADFTRGRTYAEIMWATGGDPKAVQQHLKTKFPSNRASRRSTGTASAKRTR